MKLIISTIANVILMGLLYLAMQSNLRLRYERDLNRSQIEGYKKHLKLQEDEIAHHQKDALLYKAKLNESSNKIDGMLGILKGDKPNFLGE